MNMKNIFGSVETYQIYEYCRVDKGSGFSDTVWSSLRKLNGWKRTGRVDSSIK